MTDAVVLYESIDGVAVVTINRPEKRNALSTAVRDQMAAAWQRFQAGDDRVAILTGAGEHFSGGADLDDAPEMWAFSPGVARPLDKPVIAAVDGWCVGGGVILVQHCDLCIASDRARFSYPEAKVGFSGGMISSIVSRIPHKVAMEFILLGEPMTAERAYEIGFVNKVVPPTELMDTAMDYARRLAENAPLVLSLIKRHVEEVLPKGPSERAGRARAEVATTFDSEDLREGLAAFKEKRKPRFDGR